MHNVRCVHRYILINFCVIIIIITKHLLKRYHIVSFYFFLLPKSIEKGQFFALCPDDTSLTLCSSSWFLHCDSTKASLVWASSSSRFRNLCSDESCDEWLALSSSSEVLPSLACVFVCNMVSMIWMSISKTLSLTLTSNSSWLSSSCCFWCPSSSRWNT